MKIIWESFTCPSECKRFLLYLSITLLGWSEESGDIGNCSSGCFCNSIALSPHEDASAETTVSQLGSKSARTGLEIRACLISWNTSHCGLPHTRWFLFSNSRKGFVLSAKFGANLLRWFTIPRKHRMSPTLLGDFTFCIAATFSGSGQIPFWSTTCPRNLTCDCEYWHFSRFSVNPASSSLWRTFVRRSSCSSTVCPCTKMSSIVQTTPSKPLNRSDVSLKVFWRRGNSKWQLTKTVSTERGYESSQQCTLRG